MRSENKTLSALDSISIFNCILEFSLLLQHHLQSKSFLFNFRFTKWKLLFTFCFVDDECANCWVFKMQINILNFFFECGISDDF